MKTSHLRGLAAAAVLASVVPAVQAQTIEQAKAAYPQFDARYYHDKYPDLQKVIGYKPDDLLMHFIKHGQNELRAPSASGDAKKVSYTQWAAGCNKGWWGGVWHEVVKGKGGVHILKNVWHHYCDENVYKYAIAFDDFKDPPRSAHGKSFMRAGDYIKDGEYMVSEGAHFIAAMQSDGNFCIYQGSSPAKIHGSNKWCTLRGASPGNGKYFAIMQGDGNFCVYKGTGPADNKGHVNCYPGKGLNATPPYYFLALQNDNMREPNLAIYRGSGPGNNLGWIWDRITTAPPKPDTVWESIGKGIVKGAGAVNQAMIDYTKAKETSTTTPPW
ncbi:hypothetical protein [Usitatibacter palustris]|uniref:Uncharacterized protein n=1 Tax=Usitatibacter palustris TaxID=2732487 RepID=A0A6M4H968_9PROT|nr:hypothetical protein [Usitatibacter palustris]QJR14934.1 hypothetical protein DSM104440_01749 [Usitatibacter palustris]